MIHVFLCIPTNYTETKGTEQYEDIPKPRKPDEPVGKPKLKKVHQEEVVESAMEKLKRLENGKHHCGNMSSRS